MVGGIMAPDDVHILIPKTCEYVILYGKSDFTDMIILRVLRCGDYLDGPILGVTAAIKTNASAHQRHFL